jgi:protein-S-isoprenylcysteine O-methyltransferase Ste14
MVNLWLLVTQIVGMALLFALVIFLSAGSVAWLPGWLYLGELFIFVIAISLWLLHRNPALLRERMTGVGAQDQKTWDKALLAIVGLLFVGWLALMPADAGRFHWTTLPPWLQVLGALILLSSYPLFFWVFAVNPYLSPAVRLQEERDHSVISSGPYRYVRHPMYAAVIPFFAGTSLLLGSAWGLAGALALVITVAVRAVLEERTLAAELPGYREYAQRVTYRLIPGVW